MIADLQKQLDEAFRLKQATTGSLLSMGMVFKGLSAMVKGHGIGIPKGVCVSFPVYLSSMPRAASASAIIPGILPIIKKPGVLLAALRSGAKG